MPPFAGIQIEHLQNRDLLDTWCGHAAAEQSVGRLFFPQTASRDFRFSRRVVNAKFHGFCPSEGSDERKTVKMTFPPWRKCGNRQNLRFRHGGKTENGKKYVSATAEKRKTVKNTFPPRRKCGNRQNLRFRHGGKTKIDKIYVSATAEMRKSVKNTFPPRRKYKK